MERLPTESKQIEAPQIKPNLTIQFNRHDGQVFMIDNRTTNHNRSEMNELYPE